MSFSIQTSEPLFTGKKDDEDDTLSGCIDTAFVLETEDALMRWNSIFIPLGYKYTIGDVMPDMLEMLEELLNETSGALKVSWPCSSFRGNWRMIWHEDDLLIDAQWDVVNGNLEALLNEHSRLEVPKQQFIREWKALLGKLISALDFSNYTETDGCEIDRLLKVHSRIDKHGSLYSHLDNSSA